MRSVEKEGRTAEEAIGKALEDLGIARDQAQIEILSSTSRKVFRLLAGRGTRVRVTALEEDSLLEETKRILSRILQGMGIQAEIAGQRNQEQVVLEIKSPAGALLIGRKGRTLDALQFLLNRILNANGIKRGRVLLDTEGYQARRREEIVSFAHRSAEKAKSSSKEVVLIPLGPYERRIIHLSLQEDPGVETFSEGLDYRRKVHVVPTGAKEALPEGDVGRPSGPDGV